MSYLTNKDFLIEVVKGNVPGHSIVNKFGHNLATASGEDVWGGGGTYPFFPTAAVNVDIVSTDADDTSGDTGAIQVSVEGLDANWDKQTETVTLNGTTPVQLTNTFVRMFRAYVLESGASNENEGNITVYARSTGSGVPSGDVGIYIGATQGQTQQTIFTIPAGHTAMFIKGYVGIADDDKNGEVALFRWKARANNGLNGAWLTKGEIGCNSAGSGHWQYEYGAPAGMLPAKTDIRIHCFQATATLATVGGYDLLMVEDGY